MLSISLAGESASQDEKSEYLDLVQKSRSELQEKIMQFAAERQAFEHRLKTAQQTIDQQHIELQQIRNSSVLPTSTILVSSFLPSRAARLGSTLGTLKGQVISLRQSYNDEIQALWVSVGKSMEAILSIAKAESTRNRTQITQLHHDATILSSRNSELESAMSKDAVVYEAAEAALVFERVRWENRVFELQDCLNKAENSVFSLNFSIDELKESLKAVNAQLLAQQLRMAGLLGTLCPLFSPNDHVLSTMTDGLCPNIFVLRMCCRICSQHNPEFSAALLSHFDFLPPDSVGGSSANQASEFHESALKLHQARVGPTITFSLQLLYNSIQEAIRSKSQATSDIHARLLASNSATFTLEVSHRRCFALRFFSMIFSGRKAALRTARRGAQEYSCKFLLHFVFLIIFSGQSQAQSSNNAVFSVENANVRCFPFDCSPVDDLMQLKQQLRELESRLERQAAQVFPCF
jgi:hypothetical protein